MAIETAGVACPKCGKTCGKGAVICVGCGQALKAGVASAAIPRKPPLL